MIHWVDTILSVFFTGLVRERCMNGELFTVFVSIFMQNSPGSIPYIHGVFFIWFYDTYVFFTGFAQI